MFVTGKPEGVTNDEVSMKKISKRKIRSVMEAMLNSGLTLFFELKFIYLGSCSKSMKSIDVYSILWTIF